MPDPGMNTRNPGPYEPIACSLYDVLESAALLKSPLFLVLGDRQMNVLIKDVFAKGRGEFLKGTDTETGAEHVVRLDMIRQIIDPATKRTYRSDHC